MTFNIETLYSMFLSIGGGIIGGLISLRIHADSKKMWRNEIFVKKMQEKLVNFYYSLYENIKNDYDSSLLSSLLNNEFDFNSIAFPSFFIDRLKKAQELDEQFIFIQPYLKKCLKIKEKELQKIFMYLGTSTLIYKFFVSIQELVEVGPDMDDFFNINYIEELNDRQLIDMLPATHDDLQKKFKIHLSAVNITLSKENQKNIKSLDEDKYYYRTYLAQIRENLFKFSKLISNYMWKEL